MREMAVGETSARTGAKPYFVAIEGFDGSGKETQSLLLRNALKNRSLKAGSVSRPCYGTPSAALVRLNKIGQK